MLLIPTRHRVCIGTSLWCDGRCSTVMAFALQSRSCLNSSTCLRNLRRTRICTVAALALPIQQDCRTIRCKAAAGSLGVDWPQDGQPRPAAAAAADAAPVVSLPLHLCPDSRLLLSIKIPCQHTSCSCVLRQGTWGVSRFQPA
jgi:hypothetical protein